MRTPTAFVAVIVLLSSTVVFADDPLVWDNGDFYHEPNELVWTFLGSLITGAGYDNAIAEDFILGQNTSITSVQWTGAEWGFNGMPDAFVINFYASDPSGTTPAQGIADPYDSALASYFIPIGDIEATETDIWPGPDPFYNFTASLQTPFDANGGELLWISIQAYFETVGDFGWVQSELSQLNSPAATNDGIWDPIHFSEDAYHGDLTFKLYGTPVPAPGALALLGMAGLITRRRRRA